MTTTGQSNTASAIQELWSRANAESSVSGFGLTLDSNGYQIGIEALNGGANHNYIKIRTDRFIIGSDNLDFIPFEVRDGVVYIKTAVIENLTIPGTKLEQNAVTAISSFYNNFGGYHLTNSTYNYVGGNGNPAQVVLTTGIDPSKVVITAFVIFERDGGDNDNLNVTVTRTGGAGLTRLAEYDNIQVTNEKRSASFSWVDENVLANTAYTYILTQKAIGSDGSPYWYNVTFTGICFKK